jgi:hypothetical protein
VAVVLAGLLLSAIAVRSTVAEVFQVSRPVVALGWQPRHAEAAARVAQRLIAADHVSEGAELARQALARSPLLPQGYAALGLASERADDPARAKRFMTLSDRISRRETSTQLWLIQRSITEERFDETIRHFDIAMRTSSRGSTDLMPILVAATADPRIIPPLSSLLDHEPEWKADFLMNLAINGPVVGNVERLSRGRLDPEKADERAVLARFIQRLVYEGRYDAAWSTYRDVHPELPDTAAGSLRDGQFAGSGGFPPLDWQLVEEDGLTAMREARRDGRQGIALALVAEAGRAGEVARQFIRLPPGRYQLQFDAGEIPERLLDRPQLSVSCADSASPFYQVRPSRSGSERVNGEFAVPGCRWQVVSIRIGSNESSDEFPWISGITLRSVSGRGQP